MNKRCIGCGIILQDKDEQVLGYTPDLKNAYCRRCFRLKNYGEKKEETIDDTKIIEKVNKQECIVFFLCDYLNINRITISLFKKIKPKKYFVISKTDTLRREMKEEKIKLWLKTVYNIEEPVLFISSNPQFKSNNIFKVMDEEKINTCYLMGLTNVGKSTFLNKLLKENKIKKEILASDKPNTTLDFIKIKIGDYIVYDTPGFSYENSALAITKKEIKPISYRITPNSSLVINNYEFFFSTPNKVVYYGLVPITRKFTQISGNIRVNISANHDIVLPGIGFLNIKEPCVVLTNMPNLEVRLNISGGANE